MVSGIENFYINNNGKIKSVYVEFNSLGWSQNLGYPECDA
jgi:hypothetical protein